jgi:hypothetical protein
MESWTTALIQRSPTLSFVVAPVVRRLRGLMNEGRASLQSSLIVIGESLVI